MDNNMNNNMNQQANQGQQMYQNQQTYQNQAYAYRGPVKQKNTFEQNLGKNVMGVLASVLIFAGIILLATAASEVMTDVIKMVSILSLSVVMAAVGLIGIHVKKNSFFISLAGCGVGAIFISIILAYSYFELINLGVMYIGLGLWSVLVSFLGGKDAIVFRSIGQIGVLASLIFGTTELARGTEGSGLIFAIVLVLFYIVISCFYLFLDRNGKKGGTLFSITVDMIGVIFLYVSFIQVAPELFIMGRVLVAVIIDLYACALVAVYIIRLIEKDKNTGYDFYLAILIIYNLIAVLICSGIMFAGAIEDNFLVGLMGLFYITGVWAVVSLRRKDDGVNIAVKTCLFVSAVLMAAFLGVITDICGLGIYVIPFLIVALISGKKKYYVFSLISFSFYALVGSQYNLLFILFGIIYLLAFLIVLAFKKDLYMQMFKIWLYVVANVFLLRLGAVFIKETSMSTVVSYNIIFYLTVALCALCTYIKFSVNWVTGAREKGALWFIRISNLYVMLFGTIMLFATRDDLYKGLTAFFLFIAVASNFYPMIVEYRNNGLLGFYNCVKLTLYMIFVLIAFKADSYIITFVCLLVAIAGIAFGFALRYKVTRIYGLILSICSILKLVLFDIEYNSNITRAITVIICGIIAFTICFIYNMLDKKMFGDEKNIANQIPASQVQYQQAMSQNMTYGQQATMTYAQQAKQSMPYGQPVVAPVQTVVEPVVAAEESVVTEPIVATEEPVVEATEETVAPIEEKVVATEETVVPTEETVVPTEETVAATEETVVPTEDMVVTEQIVTEDITGASDDNV